MLAGQIHVKHIATMKIMHSTGTFSISLDHCVSLEKRETKQVDAIYRRPQVQVEAKHHQTS